jgi:hypothetical protein
MAVEADEIAKRHGQRMILGPPRDLLASGIRYGG